MFRFIDEVSGFKRLVFFKKMVASAQIVINTVKGVFVSVADALGGNAKSVLVDINPVQDLNGYNKPWSAGGGVNKIKLSDAISSMAGSSYGLTTSMDGERIKIDGDYNHTGSNASFRLLWLNTSDYDFTNLNVEGFIVSGISSSNVYANVIRYSDSNRNALAIDLMNLTPNQHYTILIDAVFYEGSTAPTSWTPYSNECPISGWTGAEVNVSGINVWDEEWENGTFNITTGENINTVYANMQIRTKNLIPVKGNTAYYFYCPIAYTGGHGMWTMFYDGNREIITGITIPNAEKAGNSFLINKKAVTTPANAKFCKFYMTDAYGNTYNHDISINYPSTDHDYHAYHGTTYPISWQTEAGTVYGGTLDVTSGVLTVTHRIVDAGTLNWRYLAPTSAIPYGTFYDSLYDKAYGQFNLICEAYPIIAGFSNDNAMQGNSASNTIYAQNSSFNGDAAAFKASLSGVHIVYELATPQTYQLTPTDIALLQGQNNVWADCGDTEVTYEAIS